MAAFVGLDAAKNGIDEGVGVWLAVAVAVLTAYNTFLSPKDKEAKYRSKADTYRVLAGDAENYYAVECGAPGSGLNDRRLRLTVNLAFKSSHMHSSTPDGLEEGASAVPSASGRACASAPRDGACHHRHAVTRADPGVAFPAVRDTSRIRRAASAGSSRDFT